MSHVTTVDLHIRSLASLKEAAEAIGLAFVEGKTRFKWYGHHVGDYPLPEGFKASDMGKCEHVLAIPGNDRAYECGVVRRRDGKEGYTLMWDFFAGGHGLRDAIGKDGVRIRASYAEAVAMQKLRAKGCRVTAEERVVNGRRKRVLRATR